MSPATFSTHSHSKPGWIALLSVVVLFASACDPPVSKPPYQDLTHYSTVFQRDKFYRLYLPEGYDRNEDRYPVVYFFHGWGGRYKSDDNAKLAYEKLQTLVDKYKVIMVMWDGNVDENEPRPYNIGNHGDVRYPVQMKDYFTELVHYVDSAYRTKSDREHRGIIGFSMGGFMSYFLAGKYPDQASAAVGMTGSPEFFVGYPENHTLYPVRYAFQNLENVKLRFHNSTADELTDLNTEVHQGAQWYGNLSFDYWQFEGGHVVDLPGETAVFERAMKFVSQAFGDPLPLPTRWSHYDLYSDFSLYDYTVTSSKKEPGFINLSNVTKHGFDISTLKWLPDGPAVGKCSVEVTTASLYAPGADLTVRRYQKSSGRSSVSKVKADASGRLHVLFDEQSYEVGISDGSTTDFSFVDYTLDDKLRYLRAGQPAKLKITLFNRTGLAGRGDVKVSLSSSDTATTITPSELAMKVPVDLAVIESASFDIQTTKIPPGNGAPPWIRVKLDVTASDLKYSEYFTIPVYFNVPEADQLFIDDGKAASDSIAIVGHGNGNGVVNPGEQVAVYTNGHRLKIYTDDPWVVSSEEKVVEDVLPAKWPDGYSLSSVVMIDPKCPDGHVIEAIANYETKEFMPIKRIVHWRKIKLRVMRK